LAILAFWLATAGWWFYREVGTALWYNEPPPFTIDLADEVRAATGAIDWRVYKDNQPVASPMFRAERIGTANTEIRYVNQEDAFDLTGTFDFSLPLIENLPLIEKPVDAHLMLTSLYRVSREGNLRWVKANINASVAVARLDFRACLEGPVLDRRFSPQLRILSSPWGASQEIRLSPVELSGRGSVLNPMHPVNRIAGLRPGQRWRMPLVDPVNVALSGLLPSSGGQVPVQFLEAKVAAEPRSLWWDDELMQCFLIRYSNEETTACTWVRQSDEKVLQQEVSSVGQRTRLILQRRPQRDRPSLAPG
jgi:hypothetical protein